MSNLDSVAELILPPRRVRQILWATFCATIVCIILFLVIGAWKIAAMLAVAFCLIVRCLWYSYHHQLRRAAITFTITLSIMTCSLMFVSGGIHDETICIIPSILLICSLFGSPRQYVLLIAAIVAFLTFIVVANINGWMESEVLTTNVPSLLTIVVLLVTNGFFIFVLSNDFRKALLRLNSSEKNLLELNEKLENRVAARVAQLQESESHVSAILRHTADGIITVDSNGIVLSFNPASVRIFGFNAAEVIGKHIRSVLPESMGANAGLFISSGHHADEAEAGGTGHELLGLHKDGHPIAVELTVSEMRANGKNIFIGIVRDITARRQTEQLKSEFISTVSHELRTPLTSILGALTLVNEGRLGEVPKPIQSMLDIAQRNGQRLNFLINDILDIEKLDSGKMTFDMQVQSLRSLVEKTIASNQTYRAERGVALRLSESDVDALVNVDSQRLMQVLSNLLSNALKYSPDNGTVEVSIEQEQDEIRVAVKDQGSGIPEEFRARIFGKFAQADSSDTRLKGGTGLGLSITKKLVEHMHGRIGFESVAGCGATFFVTFPVCQTLPGI